MTEQEANGELSRLVENIEKAFKEAEDFADAHSLEFSMYRTYGMGGHYTSKMSKIRDVMVCESLTLEEALEEAKHWERDEDYGWFSSTQGCN